MPAAHAVSPPPADSTMSAAAALAPVDGGRALFDLLRQSSRQVPAGLYDRADTAKLLALADWELRDFSDAVASETSAGPGYAHRGWYQDLYREQFRGKRVLEIGGGGGIDALHFIRHGAIWHFAEFSPSNLTLIRRLLDIFGLSCDGMTQIEDMGSLDRIPGDFDFIFCNGAMIHLPFAVARLATARLAAHLKPAGRWIERGYTRERWVREGRLPFDDWGKLTNGPDTPWAEWCDIDRLRERFAPLAATPILAFAYRDNDDAWFDLRVDASPLRAEEGPVIALTSLLRRHLGEDGASLAPALPVAVRSVPVAALDRAFGYAEPSDSIADEDALLDYFERNHGGNTVLIAGHEGWDRALPNTADIVLIDGAQGADALCRDTDRAIGLLRRGGLLFWHGFCPDGEALAIYPEARALALAVHQRWRTWSPAFATMFWVTGSRLLVGIKR